MYSDAPSTGFQVNTTPDEAITARNPVGIEGTPSASGLTKSII
jgi:hypothetical protein